MITLREPAESDWTAIGSLANAAVRHIPGAPAQGEWLANRRAFRGERRHVVVERATRIVGYGAIERSDGVRARLFLVLQWLDTCSGTIAETLFQRLQDDARELGIGYIWVREYADDRPFIGFLLAQGFELDQEFEHAGMTVLDLNCAIPAEIRPN